MREEDEIRAAVIALAEAQAAGEDIADALPHGEAWAATAAASDEVGAEDALDPEPVSYTHLIETLYYELSEGVDLSELPERVLAPLDPRLAPPESQVLMDLVCQRACAAGDDMRFGPVLRLLNISWFFRYFNVLPRLNVLVGLLLRNILALKWGFPVLSWIPEGFDPTLAEAPVDAAHYEAVFESWSTDYGFGFDFTPYF